MHSSPVDIVKFLTDKHKVPEVDAIHFIQDMLPGIQKIDPTIFFCNIVEPFFIVTVIIGMKVQHIVAQDDELSNSISDQWVHRLPFQIQDIIIQAVVPFSDEFYKTELSFVI